jgi:iron complex outermembrane recepter protein
MKKILLLFFFNLMLLSVFSQTYSVSGTVIDESTNETIIGATVLYAQGKGTVTDVNGRFSLDLEPGNYNLTFSYVGFEEVTREITVQTKPLMLSVKLKSLTIDEVIVVADVARSRQTPVAFTNVSPQLIEEELSGQDLPMVLNTTPGVYATQQGGGDGDARITIRGFDQRNIAVMLDGVPVNDMENGWVYWSNWFGLDLVTRMTQVQRGLGASQLALPSVGGTINILTKGIENKRETSISQDIDSQGKIRTTIGFTSGKLASGWGFTLAGSYKRGNGWVDNTFSEGWFYYAKIDKRIRNHLFTLTAMGAPQHHDQREFQLPIATYDSKYAEKLGIDVAALDTISTTFKLQNLGRQYNQHWGVLRRDRFDSNAPEEKLTEKSNIYHKPQFSIRDFWSISDNLTLSTILYLSVGKGGKIRPRYSLKTTNLIQDANDEHYGQIDWQSIYDENTKPSNTGFELIYPIDTNYSFTAYYSNNYMVCQHNEHYWYGLLSKINYQPTSSLNISGGIDLRAYRGIHYSTITDLLGGDYAIDKEDKRNNYDANPQLAMHYVDDTIWFYSKGLVKWGGLFAQVEKKFGRFLSFVNITTALNGYKKIDYFRDVESTWLWKPGFTFKTGGTYLATDKSQFFLNLGYISKGRAFKNVFNSNFAEFLDNTDNERVKAIEGGYKFSSVHFSLNVNSYYTAWENKPPDNTIYSTYNLQPGDEGYTPDDPRKNEVDVYANIPGMDARHMGIEADFIIKPNSKLELQGTLSLGDWIWTNSVKDLQYYNSDTHEPVNKTISFDARGIHVGNAAQNQIGSSVRYMPFKGYYLTLRQTYYGKYYSNFSPETTVDDEGNVVDSWKIPSFNLFDVHSGYRFHLNPIEKVTFGIKFSVLNILDTPYIWDATNNDGYGPYKDFYQDFDAKSATVFFGMGRRYNLSFKITF